MTEIIQKLSFPNYKTIKYLFLIVLLHKKILRFCCHPVILLLEIRLMNGVTVRHDGNKSPSFAYLDLSFSDKK